MPGDHGKSYLTTTPGTQVIFTVTAKGRVPCWHCRTWRRLLNRRHWLCSPRPKLEYIDASPPHS